MFGDINYLGVFEPDILNIDRKFINNVLENFDTLDGWGVQPFNKKSKFFKKLIFFVTSYDKKVLLSWYMLINNGNINGDGDVIRWESSV